MCWKVKIPTPDMSGAQIQAPEPPPLTEEPQGVIFGGDDKMKDDTDAFGRKQVKVPKLQAAQPQRRTYG